MGDIRDVHVLRLSNFAFRRAQPPWVVTRTPLPALERATINTGKRTSGVQASPRSLRLPDTLGESVAIVQRNHSSAPSRKIAESFVESTNKAAVSAKALSLRRISRSSSWMRRRSLRVSSAGLEPQPGWPMPRSPDRARPPDPRDRGPVRDTRRS